MCEFLIKARDPIDLPANTEKRERGYKRGDIVVVMPDGHEWGREERLPKFYVIKVPGMSVETARQFTDPYYTDTGLVDANGDRVMRLTARRKWKALIDNVPNRILRTLNETGQYSIAWNSIKTYVYNKLTTQTAA